MADKVKRDPVENEENESTSKGWFGPNGECWCEEKNKYVHPTTCLTCHCPECKLLPGTNTRQFRYLHLHDDYKSASEKIVFEVLAREIK